MDCRDDPAVLPAAAECVPATMIWRSSEDCAWYITTAKIDRKLFGKISSAIQSVLQRGQSVSMGSLRRCDTGYARLCSCKLNKNPFRLLLHGTDSSENGVLTDTCFSVVCTSIVAIFSAFVKPFSAIFLCNDFNPIRLKFAIHRPNQQIFG